MSQNFLQSNYIVYNIYSLYILFVIKIGGKTVDIPTFTKMFWDYSKKINDHIHSAFHPLIEKYELTLLQARILVELHNHEDHTIGSLANRINMAGTNISTMCKKLEGRGYVKRVRDSKDERIVNVVLTKEGCEIVEAFERELNRRISLYTQHESRQKLDDIIVGVKELERLLQHLGNQQETK